MKHTMASLIAGIAVVASVGLSHHAWSFGGQHVGRIAVLDFELNDLTLRPRTPQELARTASIAPLLRDALSRKHDYELVTIPPATQAFANSAFGYLFTHADDAATLALKHKAEWIVIGRLQKSNDLFAYVTTRVVHAGSARLVGEFYAEIKGPVTMASLTQRGVARLADQIGDAISRRDQQHQ